MTADPAQLGSNMSVDQSFVPIPSNHSQNDGDSSDSQNSSGPPSPKRADTKLPPTEELPDQPDNLTHQMSLDTADGKESKDENDNNDTNTDVIQFTDTPFAKSLIPHINLIGITDRNIQKLCPSQSTASWIDLGVNNVDVEDATYLLLDNHTKLLRCGGLHGDKYVNTASICDLSRNNRNDSQSDDNANESKIEWVSLPSMNYRRHGHQTLCVELDQSPYIMTVGGFDAKGNTLKHSEIISVDHIQSHIKNNHNNHKNDNQNQGKGGHKSSKWTVPAIMELAIGLADFGVCCDERNHRIYICGGLDAQFQSRNECTVFDITTQKWIHLPKLKYHRHCNRTQLLFSNDRNPHVLMTFGGWTGNSRNSVEILDLRSNVQKWTSDERINKTKSNDEVGVKAKMKKGKGHGLGVFNYPHSNCASIVKRVEEIESGKDNVKHIQQQLNGLNINESRRDENVVIVCGHREGLFVETNVIEALEMRTRKWHTVARFTAAENHNVNQKLINAQQTPVPKDNSTIPMDRYRKYHRHSNAYRFLTLI